MQRSGIGMNIAYCEDEKIQLEYMGNKSDQKMGRWGKEKAPSAIYFGYGSAKEAVIEHPDSFPFDLPGGIDMDGMDGNGAYE